MQETFLDKQKGLLPRCGPGRPRFTRLLNLEVLNFLGQLWNPNLKRGWKSDEIPSIVTTDES
jgi:hypothetical protein